MIGNIYITGGGQWENTSVAASGTPKVYTDYNVGIGTDNPSYLIDAHTSSGNAQLRVKSGGDLSQLILESTDTSGYSQINFADAGSSNIGMLQYFHSDNHMEFTVNSAERLRITSDGLVGIGIDVPQGELHVKRTSGTGRIMVEGASLAQIGLRDNAGGTDSKVIQIRNNAQNLLIGTQTDSYQSFSEKVRITSGGNIGINDSGPNFHLDVNGNIALREGQVLTWHDGSGNKAGDIYMDSSDNFVIRNTSSVAERLRITSGGKIGIGVASPSEMMEITNTGGTGSQIQLRDTSTGTGAGDGVRFGYNGSGAQIWNFESTYIRFATSNVERLRIDSDGQANFDKGAPGSANQVIARFQAQSSRRLDIVWHDSGSLMGFDTPSNHSYIFKTNGTERLRITSAGVVNIGDGTPDADGSGALNVYSGTSGALSQFVHSAGNGGLRIGGTGSGSAANLVFSNDYNNSSWIDEWTIQMHGSDDSLRFLSGGVSGTERVRITAGGALTIGTTADNPGDGNTCLQLVLRLDQMANTTLVAVPMVDT